MMWDDGWKCADCYGTGSIEGIGNRLLKCDTCYGLGQGQFQPVDEWFARMREAADTEIHALPHSL
jgi:DnaJ-class molecular chaperone